MDLRHLSDCERRQPFPQERSPSPPEPLTILKIAPDLVDPTDIEEALSKLQVRPERAELRRVDRVSRRSKVGACGFDIAGVERKLSFYNLSPVLKVARIPPSRVGLQQPSSCLRAITQLAQRTAVIRRKGRAERNHCPPQLKLSRLRSYMLFVCCAGHYSPYLSSQSFMHWANTSDAHR